VDVDVVEHASSIAKDGHRRTRNLGDPADAGASGRPYRRDAGSINRKEHPVRTWIILAVVAVAVASAAAIASARPAKPQAPSTAQTSAALAAQVAAARAATAKYVSNLALAKRDGYGIITKMIPNMGYHFMNPNVKGFDVTKPPILVYEHKDGKWQLGALEWVYPAKPAAPPFPGATYGSFGAGCHYKDGSYVPAETQDACPKTAPDSGAAFNFWHPLLVTLHLWAWHPNPSGLFSGTNPLAAAYNAG
jgi:hypothetical protein